jgi:hypothetical protein
LTMLFTPFITLGICLFGLSSAASLGQDQGLSKRQGNKGRNPEWNGQWQGRYNLTDAQIKFKPDPKPTGKSNSCLITADYVSATGKKQYKEKTEYHLTQSSFSPFSSRQSRCTGGGPRYGIHMQGFNDQSWKAFSYHRSTKGGGGDLYEYVFQEGDTRPEIKKD